MTVALDPSIALQVKPLNIEPRMNALAQIMQLQNVQRQNELGQMQLDQTRMGNERQNALRAYLPGKDLNTPEGQADLTRQFPMEAGDVLKPVLAAAETRSKIAERSADTTAKALAYSREMLPLVQTPEHMATWMRGLYVNPVTREAIQGQFGTYEDAVKRIPSTPAEFQDFLQKNAMGMDKYIANQTQQRGQNMTQQSAREGHAVTMRGQNMTDARSREANGQAMTKPFEVTGPDGKPMLVQQDKQGNITPVAGFGPKAGASKPLNDSQAKALLFGSRMQEADKILNGLSAKGVDTPSFTKEVAESVPLIGGALGAAANFGASADQQSVEQAQRDFVNAVLRRESGAAISDSEFANAKKQYFNARGDSDQVKGQKAANRQLAIKGLLAEVPEGQRDAISQPTTKTASDHPPEIASLLDKYGK